MGWPLDGVLSLNNAIFEDGGIIEAGVINIL